MSIWGVALYSSAERDGASLPSADVAVKFGDVLKRYAFELIHFLGSVFWGFFLPNFCAHI